MSMLDDIRALMAEMDAEARAHEEEIERVLGIARQNGWGVFASTLDFWATPHVKAGTVIVSSLAAETNPLRNFEFRPVLPEYRRNVIWGWWPSPVYRQPGMSLAKPIDLVITDVV